MLRLLAAIILIFAPNFLLAERIWYDCLSETSPKSAKLDIGEEELKFNSISYVKQDTGKYQKSLDYYTAYVLQTTGDNVTIAGTMNMRGRTSIFTFDNSTHLLTHIESKLDITRPEGKFGNATSRLITNKMVWGCVKSFKQP